MEREGWAMQCIDESKKGLILSSKNGVNGWWQ